MNFNKACEIEDFDDPQLVEVMRDVARHKLVELPDFPKGVEHRKDWETAMAVHTLGHFGALGPDAVVLGVAAGSEDTLFYLTSHARQVFATDRYFSPGEWGADAPVSLLIEPATVAPYEFDPARLVVQHMDARSLRYPDDFFDGVFSSGSIEHVGELTDVANAAYEMGRVLKPGGVLSLSTEIRLSGPSGGIGWPGLTLLLSPENLQRYIVEASGLEPVDELRPTVSAETLNTRRSLSGAILDREARLARAAESGGPAGYACWEFPHVVLEHGEYVLTSVHLALRKTDRYPVAPNDWAAPPPSRLEAIREWNVGAVAAAKGIAAAEPQEDAGATDVAVRPPEPVPVASRGSRSTPAPRFMPRPHTLEGRYAARLARASEIEQRVDDIEDVRRGIDAHIATIRQLEAEASRLLEEGEAAADGQRRTAPLEAAVTNRATTTRISLTGGLEFTVVLDPQVDDPITATLAGGRILDTVPVDLMLTIVGPGDTVLDLGAHVGQFSLPAAAAGCRVLAVEAAPANAALLRASAARNGYSELRVVEAAASDHPGTIRFSPDGPWGHVPTETSDLPIISVPAVTMDDVLAELGWDTVAFVKIDVEGSEIPALRGLSRLLGRPDAPPLLIESNAHTLAFTGLRPADLLSELESFGYTCHVAEPGRLVRVRPGDLQPQTFIDYLCFKQVPDGLARWPIDPAMTLPDKLTRLLVDCAFPNPHHRAYAATALQDAGTEILSVPQVMDALDALQNDPVEAVRDAASWWRRP